LVQEAEDTEASATGQKGACLYMCTWLISERIRDRELKTTKLTMSASSLV